MDPSLVTNIPPMKDLTTDNITENVHAINSLCTDPRLKYLFERLVTHLHDFARETRLSTNEWMAGIEFLTRVGKNCTDLRQEFILLSDTLGLSMLVDSIDHPKPPSSTEGTVLGPFHTHDAEFVEHGQVIHTDPDATRCLMLCTVKDSNGKPIEGVQIDVWEGDSKGFYDVQNPNRTGPDGRANMFTDKDGAFWFFAIVPVPYPVPSDGPVGEMLKALGRHAMRPGHIHFMFAKPGYDNLVTSLYLKGDPYEYSDAVFGVKNSLVVDLDHVKDEETAKKYNVAIGAALIKFDFVLVSDEDAAALREAKAREAMEKQGRKMKYFEGLPIPDVD